MNSLSIPIGTRSNVKRIGVVAHVDQFHPSSKSHFPKTTCRVVHDGRQIHLRFDVRDRYVRCLDRKFQGPVWRDSCVEFFVRPKPRKGYFNFEFNCAGQMLLYYVEQWKRTGDKSPLPKFTRLTAKDVAPLVIATKLQAPIDPEITKPTTWWLEATIPVSVMEKYVGKLGDLTGQRWRANFQKCGNDTSHPHWAAWSNIGPIKNFHQPERFGELVFT